MLRIFSKLFLILFVFLVLLTSCSDSSQTDDGQNDGTSDQGSQPQSPSGEGFVRDAVPFSEIEYARPDPSALINGITEATEILRAASLPYSDTLARLTRIDDELSSFITMYSYASIMVYKNSADTFYSTEYAYLSEEYPKIQKALEDMLVAAARSKDAEDLERDLFGEGFIEEYKNGGIYTSEAVSLMEKEAELTSKYTSLSTANITIVYGSLHGSYDEVVKALTNQYGEGSAAFLDAVACCDALYQKKLAIISKDIFIELLKTRRLIADSLGYSSYIEYAYGNIHKDYEASDINGLISDISSYALPVYKRLVERLIANYNPAIDPSLNHPAPNASELTEKLGGILSEINTDLSSVYSYMLNYGLYDIDSSLKNRTDTSFTTYLYSFDSPYLFVTLEGKASDYLTVAHEFGHYYDFFVNYGDDASLDLSEISSQALELLVLQRLEDELPFKYYGYLFNTAMASMLETLIFQGFYAKFEHLAYELAYSDITEDNLNALLKEAATELSLNTAIFNDLSDVIIPHLIISPLYVQSYCTSAASALEIMFAEYENEGDGLDIYLDLVNRDEGGTLEEQLAGAGLTSPFEDGFIKKIADSIYYYVMGSHYYDDLEDEDNGGGSFATIAYIKEDELIQSAA